MTEKKKSEQNRGIRMTRRKLTELMNLQWLKPDMEVRRAVQIKVLSNSRDIASFRILHFPLQKFTFIHIYCKTCISSSLILEFFICSCK